LPHLAFFLYPIFFFFPPQRFLDLTFLSPFVPLFLRCLSLPKLFLFHPPPSPSFSSPFMKHYGWLCVCPLSMELSALPYRVFYLSFCWYLTHTPDTQPRPSVLFAQRVVFLFLPFWLTPHGLTRFPPLSSRVYRVVLFPFFSPRLHCPPPPLLRSLSREIAEPNFTNLTTFPFLRTWCVTTVPLFAQSFFCLAPLFPFGSPPFVCTPTIFPLLPPCSSSSPLWIVSH